MSLEGLAARSGGPGAAGGFGVCGAANAKPAQWPLDALDVDRPHRVAAVVAQGLGPVHVQLALHLRRGGGVVGRTAAGRRGLVYLVMVNLIQVQPLHRLPAYQGDGWIGIRLDAQAQGYARRSPARSR